MSHIPNVFTAPGTPLLERTVGELVSERPGRSRVFQNFGIDFCCQGAKTLRDACAYKKVAAESVVEQLEAELADKAAPEYNPAELPIPELATYILETHHGFLWRELPRLYAMSQRVAHVHGGHTPSLIEVAEVFNELQTELIDHLRMEEKVLFPAILSLTRNQVAPMPLNEPITCLMHEHESSGNLVARLRELTNGFQPPPEACNTYRALFSGLQDLEEDLHRHIHLENSVLFPAAEDLAKV